MSNFRELYTPLQVNFVQAEKHYSDAIWIPTLATMGQGLFMTLSGHLEDRIGIRSTYFHKLSTFMDIFAQTFYWHFVFQITWRPYFCR